MTASVKPIRNFGTNSRLEALRVQLVAGEPAKRIGERIRVARLEAGFHGQRQLADRMREIAREDDGVDMPVDNQRISDWERGVNKPSDRYMDLIAKATGRDVGWFWRGDLATPDLSLHEVRSEFRGDVDGVQEQLDRIERALVDEHDGIARLLRNQEELIKGISELVEKQNTLLEGQSGLLEEIRTVVHALGVPDGSTIQDHLVQQFRDAAVRVAAERAKRS